MVSSFYSSIYFLVLLLSFIEISLPGCDITCLGHVARVRVLFPVTASQLGVECLQMPAQEPAHQTHVEQEYWQSHTGDTH